MDKTKKIRDIVNEITNFNKIIILRHVIPDGDAFGSQLGLKNLILENYSGKTVLAGGEDSEYLSFIGKMDEIKDDDYQDALVIVTDCANIERIDDSRYSLAKKIIKIDHHPNVQDFGDINWVDTDYIAASEMIAELAFVANWNVSAHTAKIIYHGMLTDSNRFLYPPTQSRTLHLAAKLLETNFDLQELYQQVYEKDISDIEITKYILNNYHTTNSGFIYYKFTNSEVTNLNIDFNNLASRVNTLSSIRNYPIWASFVQGPEYIRCELRSKPGYIVNYIASQFNGGGHANAAGAILHQWEEVDRMVSVINNYLDNMNNGK